MIFKKEARKMINAKIRIMPPVGRQSWVWREGNNVLGFNLMVGPQELVL